MHEIDLATWSRSHQFEFFRDYDIPFFNVCANVPIGKLTQFCKANNVSFFLSCLYVATKAVNAIPEMKTRIRGEKVIQHDIIHPSCTVLDADAQFRFCQFTWHDDYQQFLVQAEQDKSACLANTLHSDLGDEDRDDVTHMSVLPWVSFTSFANAKKLTKGDSIPKIVLGKYQGQVGQETLPVSVEVHHSLVDGLHVGRYFQQLEALCHAPEKLLIA